ncbi:MAG: phytanoyl-CoA dioxygenase family protein [bacterium]|nr:phytanoyl-CoA dioxygenase family protein [bacterium]
MKLTDEDIWYFKYTGFLRLPDTLPGDLVDRLNAVTDVQVQQMIEPVVWEKARSRDNPLAVRRLSKILDRDPVYLEAASHPVIQETLSGILGPHIDLLRNKHNHIMVRPPGSDPVGWHSGEEPYSYTLITALIYLEESTMGNGCIRLVPGSHMRPFSRSRRGPRSFRNCKLYYKSVPMPMPRGGVILFNDCCYHGADKNRSNSSRRSMTLAFRAHDAHDVVKDDPEKILVRGESVYSGHISPYSDYRLEPPNKNS